jgi:hypothetical protein
MTCLAGLVAALSAFAPSLLPPSTTTRRPSGVDSQTTVLFAKTEKTTPKKPFDEGLRSKLVSEAIAPWRTVRLFFYGSLGSGALIGGLITLAGTAAALTGARDDLDLNTQVCYVLCACVPFVRVRRMNECLVWALACFIARPLSHSVYALD